MNKRRVSASTSDFLEQQLPQNRKDQFPFVIKNQFWSLLLIGLILLLCLIPFIITIYFKNQFEIGFYDKYLSNEISYEEYQSSIFYLLIIASAIEIVLSPILSLGLSGSNRILKLMVIGEGFLFKEDFITGVKQNYLNTFLLTLFFTVLLGVCRFISTFFLNYLLGIPAYIMLVLIVIPVYLLSNIFSSFYEANVFQCIGNSTKLFIPYWWKYILSGIILFGVLYGLSFLSSIPVLVSAIQIALSLLVLPLYLLFLFELSASLFDKYINKDNFKEYYLLGLYNSDKE